MDTDYGGAAASVELAPADGNLEINADGIPTWHAWLAGDDTVEFDQYYRHENNGVMMYAVVYISVEDDMSVSLGLASDDSVQVLLDGREVWINNVGRPAGSKGEVQDFVFCGVEDECPLEPLESGPHLLMVKVFEGCGDNRFRLRFQDPLTGEPLTEDDGIELCFDPEECGFLPQVRFLRGDVTADGVLDVTDPIANLSFQFLGTFDPPCKTALDFDDSGELDVTDPIANLTHQFVGGPPPAPPGKVCGVDPTDDPLGCKSFAACP